MATSYSVPPAARQGQKPIASSKLGVCSTDNNIVTGVVLDVLKRGGNAADAGIAAALVQAAIEPSMTNCSGTVAALYWEQATRDIHQLDSMGRLVPHLPPFRPVPPNLGSYCPPGVPAPMACVPGFMPGLGELHRRFGSRPWAELCEYAIELAEEGHIVTSFEYGVHVWGQRFVTYFEEGQALYCPNGFLVPVGERFRNPALAETLRHTAKEGPEWFTTGGWARDFVAKGNSMGWGVALADLVANPPRWQEPLRYKHRGREIVQLAPPERQALYCSLILGVLKSLRYQEMEPLSADALWAMSHAMRWAERDCGYLHDPDIFHTPVDVLMDGGYHETVARMLQHSRPKVDLSEHLRVSRGILRTGSKGTVEMKQPAGSCELSIVDRNGNWLQMMNTLQSGGIPGMVVGGVPMVGSHASVGSMSSTIHGLSLSGWLHERARIRSVMGCTLVLEGGAPVLALGTPGKPDCAVVQVLSHVLDHGLDVSRAIDMPRMLPLGDNFDLTIENRIPAKSREGLERLGIEVTAIAPYEFHLGSFQVCQRDPVKGELRAFADPRRCGVAGGLA